MKSNIKNLHFIGIGGIGMSGIAEVFHKLGYTVSGSDISRSLVTDRLEQLGIKIYIGHDEKNIIDSQVIVVSSAIDSNNIELLASYKLKKTILPRAMMLSELMRFKYGIAIAGTHGKTTTTSLCAETLHICGLDPTYIIGGKLALSGTNALLGNSNILIAEADESDASILYLNPVVAVITNIDIEHMETYNYSEDKLIQTFIDFLHKLPFYGTAILCYEDQRVRSILSKVKRPLITYGFSKECDIQATNIKFVNQMMHYTLTIPKRNINHDIVLNLHGEHNILNSLAVIAVALEFECSIENIAKSFLNFHGVGRRCQKYNDIEWGTNKALLIDDYAHHPNELKATLSALSKSYNNDMILIFQPHRYSRTKDLFNDFVSILASVKTVIILEIYAAGEVPIPNINGNTLAQSIKAKGGNKVYFSPSLEQAKIITFSLIKNNDLIVTMGAGSIGKLPNMLLKGDL